MQVHLEYLQGFVDVIDNITLSNTQVNWTTPRRLLKQLEDKLQEVVSQRGCNLEIYGKELRKSSIYPTVNSRLTKLFFITRLTKGGLLQPPP